MKTLSLGVFREWLMRNPGGQEYVVRLQPGQSITVGRDLTSDLPLLDAGVSRHHATLSLEQEGEEGETLWVEDLHSHNGTFVNTEKVHRRRVQSGDVLTFGRIPMTLTQRQCVEEAVDPLGRVGQDKLAILVRMARQFASEPEQSTIFQQLLEQAIDALHAERGAVLLWEEERGLFHAVAALPHALFQDMPRILGKRAGETLVRGGKARLLWPDFSAKESRIELAPSPQAPTPHAVGTPLFCGSKSLGLLYIDRASSLKPFGQPDVDFLFALAWVTSGALGTSSQISDMREWNQRLESLVAQRSMDIERAGVAHSSPAREAEPPQVLKGLEDFLADAARSPLDAEAARKVLRAAALRVAAVRRLLERESARLEEVQLGPALRNAAKEVGYELDIDEGGEASVVCPPDELEIAFGLSLDLLLNCGKGGLDELGGLDAPTKRLSARCLCDESEVTLRLEQTIPEAGAGLDPLSTSLLSRWVKERLRGSLSVADDGSWLELRLPQTTLSLGETVVFSRNRISNLDRTSVQAPETSGGHR